MSLRAARPEDLPALAVLWHDAWHEAHGALVPPALARARSLANFRDRLPRLVPGLRLAADPAGLLGFCAVTTDPPGELDQLFLAPRARGTGLGARLLADGETRLLAAGCPRPVLRCHPGNARARAFYARAGWAETGLARVLVDTPEGLFGLETLTLGKTLA
jgi:GNAT superfamily N-acetyltransferase